VIRLLPWPRVLEPASPLPPTMMSTGMAHAAPEGVTPGDEATIGFLRHACSSLMNWACVFLGGAADFTDHDDRGGLGVARNISSTSMKFVPDRIAPMPTAVVWPRPSGWSGTSPHRSGVAVTGDDADAAGLDNVAGMDAICTRRRSSLPGSSADQARFRSAQRSLTRTMSSTGMPSVMQTISGISASIASQIASAAPGGGNKTTEACAPVFRALRRRCRKQATRCVERPYPRGATDHPGAVSDCALRNGCTVLARKTLQMTLVFLSIRTDMTVISLGFVCECCA